MNKFIHYFINACAYLLMLIILLIYQERLESIKYCVLSMRVRINSHKRLYYLCIDEKVGQ